MEATFFNLLAEVLRELRDPRIVWELTIICTCILFTLWLQWILQRRMPNREKRSAGERGVQRMFLPIVALILVYVARALVRPYLPISLFNLAVPLLLALALVRGIVFSLAYAFPEARWISRFERYVAWGVWGCVALYITGLSDLVIDALESVSFTVGKQRLDLWLILHGVAVAMSTILVALWFAGWLEHRLMRSEMMDSNVRVVIVRAGKSALIVIALLIALSLVGIDITALSVFGGAFVMGLGFGMKTIASNYVAGFMILLDRSIRIGNVIAIDATTSGEVMRITTRYTVVRTLAGTEVIVPNEYLVGNIVRNQTYTDSKVQITLRISVAYSTDLEQAMALMIAAAVAQSRVLKIPAPNANLVNFGENGIDLDLGFWITDPGEGTGALRSAVNLAIWRSFREHGIEFPFPQREVRILNPFEAGGGTVTGTVVKA